jgi:hypothetical protein
VRTLALALLILAASGPLHGQESPPAPRPAFKGIELYSWKECSSCAWQFVLLPGTNRLKTLAEIKEPTRKLLGVAQLKEHLLRLPKGENVFWASRSFPEMSLPEPDVIADLVDFSAQHNVTLKVER